MAKIQIQRLRSATLFKLLFLGNVFFWIPCSLFTGVLNYFGAAHITWNDAPVHGIAGFFSAVFLGLVASLLLSVFLWIDLFIGLWLYSLFKPVGIEYVPVREENDSNA